MLAAGPSHGLPAGPAPRLTPPTSERIERAQLGLRLGRAQLEERSSLGIRQAGLREIHSSDAEAAIDK